MLLSLIVFLIILTILVLIHELGHFLVAKKLNIKVEEFGFGLPPRAFGIKFGETLCSVNWLPIGGFVKLYGEDEAGAGKIQNSEFRIQNKKDIGRAFFARSPLQRASIVVAGVVMNALLAAVIFYVFLFVSGFKTQMPLLGDHKFFLVDQKNQTAILVSSVAKDSPAEKIGLKPFYAITEINGKKVTDVKEFINAINSNKGKSIMLGYEDARTHEAFTRSVTPRISPPKNQGALGIGFSAITTAVLSYQTMTQKIFSGVIHSANLLVYNLDIIGKLIGFSIKEKTTAPLSTSVTGPVGIYSLVSTIVSIPDIKERLLSGLNLAGLLSISLAFFNILPIPALDGGRLFFIVIEAISGKKVPIKVESYIHALGMTILLVLFALITFQDLLRIFS